MTSGVCTVPRGGVDRSLPPSLCSRACCRLQDSGSTEQRSPNASTSVPNEASQPKGARGTGGDYLWNLLAQEPRNRHAPQQPQPKSMANAHIACSRSLPLSQSLTHTSLSLSQPHTSLWRAGARQINSRAIHIHHSFDCNTGSQIWRYISHVLTTAAALMSTSHQASRIGDGRVSQGEDLHTRARIMARCG